MDNPQHYQPLSHALNPPVGATPHSKRGYTSSAMFSKDTVSTNNIREEEEEEDDEGLVEEQLSRADQDDQGSEPSSPGTHSARYIHLPIDCARELTISSAQIIRTVAKLGDHHLPKTPSISVDLVDHGVPKVVGRVQAKRQPKPLFSTKVIHHCSWAQDRPSIRM